MESDKESSPYLDVKFTTIDAYHAFFPPEIRQLLDRLREVIRQAMPDAQEMIRYNMPAFRQGKVSVYYAAYKKHIGFYPGSAPIKVFKETLAPYKTSKGAIQFPIDKPIPIALVKKIINFKLAGTSGQSLG